MKLAVGNVHADLTRVVLKEEHVLLHLCAFDAEWLLRVRLLLQERKEARTVIAHWSRKARLRLLHLL